LRNPADEQTSKLTPTKLEAGENHPESGKPPSQFFLHRMLYMDIY